jgi:hypothetical protein
MLKNTAAGEELEKFRVYGFERTRALGITRKEGDRLAKKVLRERTAEELAAAQAALEAARGRHYLR